MAATSEIKYDTPTAVTFFIAGIAVGSFLTLLFPSRTAGPHTPGFDGDQTDGDQTAMKENAQRIPFPTVFGT